ncbi:MAG: pteridine reductase [Betaproteobacteria bacterium]|nr:pteridine reductase [Betaproteobacteria bacterium]
MDSSLQGKVILITGGAKRVGAAICRRLHRAGADIMIHYRSSRDEALALQAELNEDRSDSTEVAQANLLDIPSLPRLVAETVGRFGGLDALINNASSFFPTAVGEITEEVWTDLIGTNLKAPLFLCQAAVPELRKRRGCIVNITDIHAERPMKSYLVYSVGKAGLVGLTKSLARELSPEVRVNAVAPGAIVWPADSQWADEDTRRAIIQRIPLKRTGEPEEIARAVAFLVADAPYVTGQVLAVDGGRSVTL